MAFLGYPKTTGVELRGVDILSGTEFHAQIYNKSSIVLNVVIKEIVIVKHALL